MKLKPIPDLPGYFAGEDGIVYSKRYRKGVDGGTRPLKSFKDSSGRYLIVCPRKNGKNITCNVHRLIALAWHGTPPEGYVASHLDGDIYNNTPQNLIWETQRENLARREAHGTTDKGINNSRAAFTPEKVRKVRRLLEQGLTQKQIAILFDVTQQTISRIATGERYANIR